MLIMAMTSLLFLVVTARYHLGVTGGPRALSHMEQLVCVDQDTVHAGHRAFVVVAAASVRTGISLWTLRPVLG